MSFTAATRNRLTLLLLWLIVYATFTLFLPPLLDDADSVHAEVAREMLLRHDWITLYANGIRYLEKAPILYWSMALSFKLFGVSTAAARLPIALTVLTLALLLEAFARQAFASTRAGLYAGLIFLSSFGIFIFTRITIPDADVCLWLTLALYAFWTTEQLVPGTPDAPPLAASPRRVGLLPCLLFAAACALNVLTKGLIGIVFPLAIVLLHLLLTRGPRGAWYRLRQLHPAAGILTFLAIAAPWHILIGLANPTHGHPAPIAFLNHHWQVPLPTDGNVHGWFWFYFINEHLLRYLNLRVPRDYDTVPLALFWGLLLIWLMPWSAYLYPALRRIPLLRALSQRPLFRSLVPLRLEARLQPCHPPSAQTPALAAERLPSSEFPQSSSHQTRHSMADAARHRQTESGAPSLPVPSPSVGSSTIKPLAASDKTLLLLAFWAATPLLFFSLSTRQEYYVLPALPALILLLAAWLANPQPQTARRTSATLAILGALAAAACLLFAFHTKTPAPNTDLATLLQQNPGDYALSFGHFLDLNAQALGLFRLPLLLTAAAFGLGLPLAYLLHRRAQPHAATLTTTVAAFLFLIAAHLGLQTFAPVLGSKAFADVLAPQLKPEDLIILHGEYESGSTLGFYLHRADLHLVEGRSSNLWYGSFFPDAPKIFETRESVAQKWLGSQRLFVWQDPSDRDRPPLQLPAPVYVLARSEGKELLSNQLNH